MATISGHSFNIGPYGKYKMKKRKHKPRGYYSLERKHKGQAKKEKIVVIWLTNT
jgi:hypothetical protein